MDQIQRDVEDICISLGEAVDCWDLVIITAGMDFCGEDFNGSGNDLGGEGSCCRLWRTRVCVIHSSGPVRAKPNGRIRSGRRNLVK